MLNVVTVYKSGGVYSEEYVKRLALGVRTYLTIDYRFICLTDTVKESVFDEDNGIQWEPLKNRWPAHFSKVEIFRPDLERYGKILFLDLSCLITGSLDEIASVDLAVTRDFYYDCPSQSVLIFEPGALRSVWGKFTYNPEYWIEEGRKCEPPKFHDQILMYDMELPYWQDLLPGQVVSYKKDCGDGLPENARIVKFHGEPRLHECEEPWVIEAWKYDGACNTPIPTIRDQIKHNLSKGYKRVFMSENGGGVCVVGGAPSLKDNLPLLSAFSAQGVDIWATNGTASYLMENGIKPTHHILMDARPDNNNFVKSPIEGVKYLIASRCHPSVFESLDGFDVSVWNSYVPAEVPELETDELWAGGGSTVCLRSMYLAAHMMGYRTIHLFGVDSSYGENHHAFPQAMNDGEAVVTVTAGDKEFTAAPWMVRQVEQFKEQCDALTKKGVRILVYGEGLLPYVAQLMKGDPASEQSSRRVLQRERPGLR